ncbi:ammonia-forming nitrite reductase cytochrome c552 subunit [Glaesserella parasuis]|uniref:Cytochrome c-552 n=2 Tax=Glaesserella parasuis TaxID=738 RepID=A0AA42EHR6_GLAPU|nr:ammonia-forming nitrite reductase cytochrome c552 subunit [Glaesserella parasuis]MDD2168443.1 ammonia-forming nitrite reductase cytochrome c552 subunit [Glaesserella parasuis]MDE4016065.1 ammonia-forming nitrite reductase cytochrome c552 subunit [Glaesserella parasuis]MDG6310365.1 ammonia-forming nitrite reductase cytochrome c552 subunit [Glaesserella parasuis]MDG6473955.1 ammonia-forming nitrite reductase cytochrome c552 subunit [Glaesserella parasuis]MDO9882427.1 ammonia-forming nitrite r
MCEEARVKKVSKMLKNSLVATMAMLGCFQAAWAGEAKEFEGPKPDVKIESANHKFAELYPLQYQSWSATAESKEVTSALEEDPRLVVLWTGYAFSKDYNKPRGHFYAVTDVRNILRTGAPMDENSGPQPMACWACKSPDVPRMIAEKGEVGYFDAKWAKYGSEIVNPIGCADCHDTTSQEFKDGKAALRVARPHVLRALEVIGWKFDTLDKHGKRAAVCSNCHVEYYFAGKEKAVTFPWDKGVDVDSIEKYFDEIKFTDWVHGLSKAPMLKAQHPDFETWALGTHGKNGVTCIDCHMPKVETKDGKVYTDHKIGNPFDNFEHTCKTCHEQSKESLQARVKEHKKQIKDVMIRLEDQLVKAHFEAKRAWEAGATEEEMKDALQAIRHAQWRWDYSAAGHGGHMHAPDVILHVIGTGLDRAADARTKLAVILTKHGVQTPIEFPDISTKAKAQKVVGIDFDKEKAAKEEFLRTVVPQWEKEAKEKGLLPADAK